jgi:hypothetical protein
LRDQPADIEELEVKTEQAIGAPHDDEYDDELAWLEEVGNPYRSMVAAAVAEPVVAAAFCYPADHCAHPMSRPVRRLVRRMRGQARWDDRLPALGTRQSVVALTDRSLLVFEYRIGSRADGLGPCLGRWARDAISLGAWRTELVQSSNGQTNRMDLLQLNATTRDGPLALDLPVADQPGIKEFEQALACSG